MIIFATIILLTSSLITYLNTTNRKIRYFFDSVRNDDSNLTFPVDSKNKSTRELYQSMARVNKQIQQLKLENQYQEQFFRILIEHLAAGIITYNSKGFIMHANSSAKRLLSTDVLTHLKQIERINGKLAEMIKNIKPSERRLIAIKTDKGEIQLSLKATSFSKNDAELVILSLQDIKYELDEKELESWMKLIRVLMHEIMNSITPITSLSESLYNMYCINGQPASPDQLNQKTISVTLQGLDVIKEQGKGLMSFVESYRKLTRIPEPEKIKFKVAEFITRIQILYNSLPGNDKIGLLVSLKNPDIEIFADPNLISLIMINLLKNAIEANEKNPVGKIMISAGIGNSENPEICVADNGPGIPKENLDEIFVPFFTTRKKGSGIGLSISRQIMKVHGGSLSVRSVPDKETIFCLSFKS